MADIVMSYIIIEKKDNEGIDIREKVESYLMDSGYELKDGYFLCDNDRINYEIKHKRNSNRYYVRLQSSMRFNKGIECLQKLDACLKKSDFCRYANLESDYDGVSLALSEKLYPIYALYERRIRQLILLVLTKAFGYSWKDKTFSEDELGNFKAKSKGNLKDILENLNLKEMEDYLFEKKTVDLHYLFDVILPKDKINNMTKDEILKKIEDMRPKSLWESNFSEIGLEEEWKKAITDVHDVRNKVAHHKKISIEEYKTTRTQLRRLNNKIIIAIDNIQDKEFTDNTSVSVLGGFGIVLSKISKAVLSLYDVADVIKGINYIVQQIVKPIKESYPYDAIETVRNATSYWSAFSNPEYMDSLILEKQEEFSRIGKQISKCVELPEIPRMDIEAIGIADTINNVTMKIDKDM